MSDIVSDSSRLVTLPNCLSLSRVVVIPVMIWAVLGRSSVLVIGLLCWVVASDVLDGVIARRTHSTSRLGTLLDHGSDALFVSAMAALCAFLGLLPAMLPLLIVLAFMQYLLDSAVLKGASLRSSNFGRWNGVGYFAVTGGAVVNHVLAQAPHLATLMMGLGWVLMLSTLVSIFDRARHYGSVAK
jgi:phosphatidylglycerophosphate synthase